MIPGGPQGASESPGRPPNCTKPKKQQRFLRVRLETALLSNSRPKRRPGSLQEGPGNLQELPGNPQEAPRKKPEAPG